MFPHWCADETQALLASLPVLGFVWIWLRVRGRLVWNKLLSKKDCECPHDHE
jgi:hypothetical protein